jgi:hypothetical protein
MLTLLVLLFVGCTQVSNHNAGLQQGNKQSNDSEKTAGQGRDPNEVAKEALSNLPQLIDEKAYKQLGIESADSLSTAVLGEPVPVYYVRLDQLSQYESGDPGTLLNDAHRIIYPIIVQGQGRLLIVLEEKEGIWRFVKYDNPKVAKNLVKVKQHKSARSGSPSSFMAIQIPGLQMLTLLGERPKDQATGLDKDLLLTPLNDTADLRQNPGFRNTTNMIMLNSDFNVESEGSRKAKDFFKMLASPANKVLSQQRSGKDPS